MNCLPSKTLHRHPSLPCNPVPAGLCSGDTPPTSVPQGLEARGGREEPGMARPGPRRADRRPFQLRGGAHRRGEERAAGPYKAACPPGSATRTAAPGAARARPPGDTRAETCVGRTAPLRACPGGAHRTAPHRTVPVPTGRTAPLRSTSCLSRQGTPHRTTPLRSCPGGAHRAALAPAEVTAPLPTAPAPAGRTVLRHPRGVPSPSPSPCAGAAGVAAAPLILGQILGSKGKSLR